MPAPGVMGHWSCKLCTNIPLKDISKHCKGATHVEPVRIAREEATSVSVATPAPGLFPQHDLWRNRAASPEPEVCDHGDSPMDIDHGKFHRVNDALGAGVDIMEGNSGSSLDDLESLYDPSPPLEPDGVESPNSSIELDNFLSRVPEVPNRGTRPRSGQAGDKTEAATDQWLPWYPLQSREVCVDLWVKKHIQTR